MRLRASRIAITVAAAGLFCALALAGLALVVGLRSPAPFGFWQGLGEALGGPRDLGPTDFVALTRRPGAALICPPDLCAATAGAESPPVFTISAERLTAKLRRVALAEPGVEELPAVGPDHLRFVRRSALLRLPDVIDGRILPRSSGASTLALHARPAMGLLDFGANRRRLERWMEALGQ